VQLAPGARLHLHRLADEGAGATLVTRLDARLSRDARLDVSAIDLGLGLSRHGADLVIAGSGAEIHSTSLQVPGERAHADQRVRVVHDAPQGISRIVARGILDERAKAIFNGRVVVQPGAQKTDSEQRLANLLLSKKAEVNAKPDLEIHADDVKCAHGATVGQLDTVALAYLRSRGIAQDEARALLLRAFVVEVLDRLAWPALQAAIAVRLKLPAEDHGNDLDADAEDAA
jgi:Fe-S cluster assembly protein SufD